MLKYPPYSFTYSFYSGTQYLFALLLQSETTNLSAPSFCFCFLDLNANKEVFKAITGYMIGKEILSCFLKTLLNKRNAKIETLNASADLFYLDIHELIFQANFVGTLTFFRLNLV